MKNKHYGFSFLLFVAFLICTNFSAQSQVIYDETPFKNPESLVRELYKSVTTKPGETTDWEKVKLMFIKEAVIVLRTGRNQTTVFSVDGFVEDFTTFVKNANIEKTGFVEKIIKLKPMVFGDMAQVLVLYEAHIPSSQRPPQQGVDNFSLIKRRDRWWIVSITNEVPKPGSPLPKELQN
jgi:hypothetical protein